MSINEFIEVCERLDWKVEDNGKYFIEQTGNGVYTISRELYASIESYVPRGDTYGE